MATHGTLGLKGRRRGSSTLSVMLVASTAAALSTVGLLAVSTGIATAILVPTFTVNTTSDGADTTPGDGICADTSLEGNQCTLRAAIMEADATPGGATVSIPAGTYTLNINPASSDLTAADSSLGDLNINAIGGGSGNVTVVGAGQTTTTITAVWGEGNVDRILAVSSGATATVSGVTISGGNLTGPQGCGSEGGDNAEGAGVLNEGTLTLNDSTVTGNSNLTTSAAGIQAGSGGGVASLDAGTTSLNGDTVTENSSGNNGGGVVQTTCGTVTGAPTLNITASNISGNSSSDDGGGVDLVSGDASISGSSTVSQNTASGDSGAVGQDGSGTLTIDSSTLSQNRASGDGGAIDSNGIGPINVTNSTVTNNTALGDGGGFGEDGGDTVTITGTVISNNHADGDGGGIGTDGGGTFNVTSSTISGNTTFGGGGGFSDDGGDAINITDSTVTSNQSNSFGGGIIGFGAGIYTIVDSTISTNIARAGGGIDTDFDTYLISGTTIANNQAQSTFNIADVRHAPQSHVHAHAHVLVQPHSTGDPGEGGGIYNDNCDVVSLTNDTISGNTSSGNGAGYITDFCSAKPPAVRHGSSRSHAAAELTGQTFLNDTINGNTAGSGTGDFVQNDVAAITMTHTIVADGSPVSCSSSNAASFVSGGYNLFSGPQCGTAGPGDLVNTEPLLGTLGNNGGPTQTELPGTSSPAVGAVPAGSCPPPPTDQRGVARPSGANGTCTIGAVEVVVTAVAPPVNFNGYRMVANEGGVFDFGIQYHGSLATTHLNAPIVGLANSPGPNGYLLAGADGGVFALGGAEFFGSLGGQMLASPVAAIAATPDGGGYWLASQNGKTYNFGDAPALPAVQVPAGDHIVGIASTNDGKGLWLTDNAGDVYTLGDAQFLGSLGGKHLNAPIVGIAAASAGQGYILAAADGGVFAFGVGFFGSVPQLLKAGQKLNAPIVGIAETHSGNGYWEVGADGGVFCFGDAPFFGSTYTQLKPGQVLNGPIVGIQHLGGSPT